MTKEMAIFKDKDKLKLDDLIPTRDNLDESMIYVEQSETLQSFRGQLNKSMRSPSKSKDNKKMESQKE